MSFSHSADTTYRYCGRLFTADEIDLMRQLIASPQRPNRAQLSRIVCDELDWLRPDGRRKDMSCRVAMLRMHRNGLITLPAPEKTNGNGRIRPRRTTASDPREPITLELRDLGKLTLSRVQTRKESSLWNELIERYHYLGYKPLPGAQMRYLVFADPVATDKAGPGENAASRQARPNESQHKALSAPLAFAHGACAHKPLLAALGFGAAAWTVAPRDKFIGWTPEQRKRNLRLVVNNARFLILPWVSVHNLASTILARVARQLQADWEGQYRYRPLLLETFVERDRFQGASYRAANWIHVGQTKGRGKLDKTHLPVVPVKDIFLYPLDKHFRKKLRATA